LKTFVVRVANSRPEIWMGNAETAEEAAAYAHAHGLVARAYVVYDWNLDRTEVEVIERAAG